MTDLGVLSGGVSSSAYSINTAGTIVGTSDLSDGDEHAFSYSGGVMSDLGTLGGSNSAVGAINSSGVIVGFSNTGSGSSAAFIYSGGVMVDLNTLLDSSGTGWTLEDANDINDNGQIVGDGINPLGQRDAFLLTLDVVPEPSACAMVVGALGLLCAVVRLKLRAERRA
jgi:probable HAF family extracellular repeat protein